MYYHFRNGECESTSTGAIEPMPGIVSVWCKENYADIKNIRLINGEVYHLEPEVGENDGTNLSS